MIVNKKRKEKILMNEHKLNGSSHLPLADE